MPDRTIKETIRTSRNVNNLTDFQFRLWVYLITFVDDSGVGSADPDILKEAVFPRKPNITREQIIDAVNALANLGMIDLFERDGKPCFCFPKFTVHQDHSSLKFRPPTLDEVKAYIAQRNSPVDPVKFFEYFSAGGWKDSAGKPVKSWKQKILTWEKFNCGLYGNAKEHPSESKKWNIRFDNE